MVSVSSTSAIASRVHARGAHAVLASVPPKGRPLPLRCRVWTRTTLGIVAPDSRSARAGLASMKAIHVPVIEDNDIATIRCSRSSRELSSRLGNESSSHGQRGITARTAEKSAYRWTMSISSGAHERESPCLGWSWGKGGVGKTIMAVSISVALADRGRPVLLTTTDGAASLSGTIVCFITRALERLMPPRERECRRE